MRRWLAAVAVVVAAQNPAWALAPEVEQAEAQASAGQVDACIATLEGYLKTSPDDPEALWRLARALYDKGELMAQTVSDAERLPIYQRIEQLSVRVQQLAPQSGYGYFWQGVAMGRVATAKGILSQLFTADDILALWMKALKTTTSYRQASGHSSFPGDVWLGIGQFYRLVPDSSAMELVAGVRGNIDTSISYLRRLQAAEPNRLEAQKELGISLLCKGYRTADEAAKAEGRDWLGRARAIPATTPIDGIDHKHIPIILSREAEACGYSRDGWEKL